MNSYDLIKRKTQVPSFASVFKTCTVRARNKTYGIRRVIIRGLVCVSILFCGFFAKAQTTHFSRTPGDWSSNGTWSTIALGGLSCGCTPDATSEVVIGDSDIVTVSSDISIKGITMENTGTLQYSAGDITISITEDGFILLNDGGVFSENNQLNADINFESGFSFLEVNTSSTFSIDNLTTSAAQLVIRGNENININGNLNHLGDQILNSNTAVLTIVGDISIQLDGIFSNSAQGTIHLIGNFASLPGQLFNFGIWKWSGTSYDTTIDSNSLNLTVGTNNVFEYSRNGNQNIIPVHYNNLVISGSGEKTIDGQVTINNNVTLSSGFIVLGENDFILNDGSATPTSGASSNSFIVTNGTGELTLKNIGALESASFPIGTSSTSFTPIVLEMSSGSSGNFSARVSTGVLQQGTAGNPNTTNVVDKTWHISEGTAGSFDGEITFNWNSSDELTGFDRNIATVNLYNGTSWESINTPDNIDFQRTISISTTDTSPLAQFAISNFETALPITLSYFEGVLESNMVRLNWETANELNNDFFTIEKSQNGEIWKPLNKKINGAGNSNSIRKYSHIDLQPYPGLSYYRLKQTDFDGAFDYSEIVQINNSNPINDRIKVFPNPSNSEITILAENIDLASFNFTNIEGKNMLKNLKIEYSDDTKIVLDISGLDPGLYLFKSLGKVIKVYKK